MSRKRVFWAIPLVGILASIAIAVFLGASPGEDPPRLTGEDVVEYDHSGSFAIKNAEREIEQGEILEDGCKFTTRLERAFGEPIKAARTLSADFTTCERLVEKGTLDPEDLVDIDEGGEGTIESSPAEPAQGSSSTRKTRHSGGVLASPLQSYYSTARFRTIWEAHQTSTLTGYSRRLSG